MQVLIFIHGGDSFTEDAQYLTFLQHDYIARYTLPWEDRESPNWRLPIAKKWLQDGGIVYMPTMPNKQNARYHDWKIVFECILARFSLDDEITLIGGSLGGCFLLKYFSEITTHTEQDVSFLDMTKDRGLMSSIDSIVKRQFRIHALHLIAACISEGDFTAPTNYEYMNSLGNRVHIWHAEDDRVVPIAVAGELAQALSGAQVHLFHSEKGYGHFHGITVFPELAEIVVAE